MFPRKLLVKIFILFTRANESLIELRLRRVVRARLLQRHMMLRVVDDLRLMTFLLHIVQQVNKVLIILVELIGYSIKLNDRRLSYLLVVACHLIVVLHRAVLFLGLFGAILLLLLLLTARFIEQINVAEALVVLLARALIHVEPVVNALLSAMSALFVEVVVFVVPVADLLIACLVLELRVVLVVDGVEEMVVEGLLRAALILFGPLVVAVAVRFAVLLVAEGLAVVQAVDGAGALACVVVEGLVFVCGIAAEACFSVVQVVFGRL